MAGCFLPQKTKKCQIPSNCIYLWLYYWLGGFHNSTVLLGIYPTASQARSRGNDGAATPTTRRAGWVGERPADIVNGVISNCIQLVLFFALLYWLLWYTGLVAARQETVVTKRKIPPSMHWFHDLLKFVFELCNVTVWCRKYDNLPQNTGRQNGIVFSNYMTYSLWWYLNYFHIYILWNGWSFIGTRHHLSYFHHCEFNFWLGLVIWPHPIANADALHTTKK